jgi:hypothetical protein
MGVGGQRHASAAFTPGEDPVPIVQEAGWAPGPVWTGAPSGIRSPDRPDRSESLYRLRYPAPVFQKASRLIAYTFFLDSFKCYRSPTPKCPKWYLSIGFSKQNSVIPPPLTTHTSIGLSRQGIMQRTNRFRNAVVTYRTQISSEESLY